MKMVSISRRDLIDWVSAKAVNAREVDPHSPQISMAGGELLCIFEENDPVERPLPRVIIIQDGKVREFLAWAATYLPFRPVTAFTRIVERTPFLTTDSTVHLPRHMRLALAGAVLGDALQNSADTVLPSRILSDALSTHSFLFARALVRGHFAALEASFSDRAARLAALFDDDSDAESIQGVWSRIRDIVTQSAYLFPVDAETERQALLATLLRSVDVHGLRRFASHEPDSNRVSNREARVRRFEQVTAELKQLRIDIYVQGFLQAFWADAIAPGSFEHGALLRTAAPKESAALCWYGFFAGLHRNSKLSSFGGGVVWRIVDAIFDAEDVFDQTQADVALDELEILAAFPETRASVAPKHSSSLCVEVLPTVYTYRSWPENAVEPRLLPERLTDLGAALADATAIYSSLVSDHRKVGRRTTKRKPRG